MSIPTALSNSGVFQMATNVVEGHIYIYEMKIHDVMVVEDGNLFTSVIRVPGGWIYRSYDKSHNILSSQFVP